MNGNDKTGNRIDLDIIISSKNLYFQSRTKVLSDVCACLCNSKEVCNIYVLLLFDRILLYSAFSLVLLRFNRW